MNVQGERCFSMRPIEAFVHWILCCAWSADEKNAYTFREARDPSEADGVIIERSTGEQFIVEHVSGLDIPQNPTPPDIRRIQEAIHRKVQKCIEKPGYGTNKNLVVFVDGVEEYSPEDLRKQYPDTEFLSIVVVRFVPRLPQEEFVFEIVPVLESSLRFYYVVIDRDFSDWEVVESVSMWKSS